MVRGEKLRIPRWQKAKEPNETRKKQESLGGKK